MTLSPYPTYRLPRFDGLAIEWCHGAGFCPGVLKWRVHGQLLAVVPAGQA